MRYGPRQGTARGPSQRLQFGVRNFPASHSPHTMPTPAQFDVYRAPLSGLHLVEASAGTGKTWTISGLYARLILELGLTVEQILVVTFTKAATAELQDRIRRRLRDVLAAFEAGHSEDPFCQGMLELHGEQAALAIRRLTRAIGGFDQATIFTIHSFCQRVLGESAFESGADFDCEVVPDERELLQEIVDDFWRREIHPASPSWAAYLAERKQSPDGWLAEVSNQVGKPFLTILGCAAPAEVSGLERARTAALADAARLWCAHRDDIRARLLGCTGFNAQKVRAGAVETWLREAGDTFDGAGGAGIPCPTLAVPDTLAKLTTTALAGAVKKNEAAPVHPFFDACETLVNADQALQDALYATLQAMKPKLLAFCNRELELRKTEARVFSYNDLLNRLAAALDGAQGERLAATIRRRYRAALIDEFQDTDPMQYRIFRTVYGAAQEARQPVFFVGDPKQAIYSFRGADVFSYLQARGEPDIAHATLMTNQRSVPGLIRAVNRLFLGRSEPFLLADIPYPEVQPAERERPALRIEDDGLPLRFLLLPEKHDAKGKETHYTKGEAASRAAAATAAEIARLLREAGAGTARLGERPLHGGDIAVLVATHSQARRVEEALRGYGVPSVRQGQDNVFESHEAMELERVLLAVAQPGREPLLKAALATELMGYTGNAIHALAQDEAAFEQRFERFQGYHQLWLSEGFMPMFRRWFEESNLTGHLPEFLDGERRLTNLLHLAELLQVESRRKPAIDTLLHWYGQVLRRRVQPEEEALLRLESDARRVKLVTIHTSKGLEYPIVFCPFLWDGRLSQRKTPAVLFHRDCQAVLDLGSPDLEAHRKQAVQEELSEKLRLLYVALTRAVHRCYVAWGDVRNSKDKGEGTHTTALAWLLHAGAEADAADPLAAMERHLRDGGQSRIAADVHAYAARADGEVGVYPLPAAGERLSGPAEDDGSNLALREFRRGFLRPSWRMTSFTGLTTGRHSEAPDHDPLPESVPEIAPGESMFTFPRGAKAGSCLHAILEEWEFTSHEGERLAELARRKLKAHGLEERWAPVVRHGLEDLLAAPLDGRDLKLGDIPAERRLVELEFTYVLHGGDAQALRRLLADPAHGCDPRFAEAARRLDFRNIAGYMKGFIDLVFEAGGKYYVVDYKSNWLGDSLPDYGPDRLATAMANEQYYLQYLIYVVALHRYLKFRLPEYDYERNFGGVYYLFLRGIVPGKNSGIYWDRPGLGLVEDLERMVGS